MLVQLNTISAISGVRTPYTNQTKNVPRISFRGEHDSFCSNPKVLTGNISEHDLGNIINTVNQAKQEGDGFSAVVYKHDNLIIKQIKPQTDDYNKYHLGDQNLKEYYALEEVAKLNPEISPKAHGIVEYKGNHLLIEDYVGGVHPQNKKLSNGQVKDLMTKFAQMDSIGVQHCDLQSGNIFLTDDKTAKIIDFGSFHYIDNTGQVAPSDITPEDMVKSSFATNTQERVKKAITKNRHIQDIKQVSDNPHSRLYSNVSNFEFRTLFLHLLDGSEEKPLEFYTDYLKEKGNTYHKNMADFYESLLPGDYEFLDRYERLSPEDKTILEARDYEKVAQQVLQEPSEPVIQTELYKMQLKAFSSSSNDIGSSIPSKQKQASIYDKLLKVLNTGIEKSEGVYRTYFEENLKKVESYAPFISRENAVEVPENEDVVNCLFKGVKSPLLEKVEEVGTKTGNKKGSVVLKGLCVVFGLGAAGLCLYKKKKN